MILTGRHVDGWYMTVMDPNNKKVLTVVKPTKSKIDYLISRLISSIRADQSVIEVMHKSSSHDIPD